MAHNVDRSLAGLKILLMEDEVDVREILAILLRLAGAEVSEVSSVAEALASYDRQRPDCILSDLNLNHDGFVLLETIRAREPGSSAITPAIALTGRVFAEDRARALAAGFRTYLTKPVDPPELLRAILEATRGASPEP